MIKPDLTIDAATPEALAALSREDLERQLKARLLDYEEHCQQMEQLLFDNFCYPVPMFAKRSAPQLLHALRMVIDGLRREKDDALKKLQALESPVQAS